MKLLSEPNLTILNLLSEGLTVKEISTRVYLSEITIRKRLERLRDDIEWSSLKPIPNTTALVAWYQKQLANLEG